MILGWWSEKELHFGDEEQKKKSWKVGLTLSILWSVAILCSLGPQFDFPNSFKNKFFFVGFFLIAMTVRK